MKLIKLLVVLFAFFFSSEIGAQTPSKKGFRSTEAQEVTTADRIPIMTVDGIIKDYITPTNLTGVNINQDNIYKVYDVASLDFTLPEIATAINGLPAFTINDIDVTFFKVSNASEISQGFVIIVLKDLGKGDYGIGGVTLTATNISVISYLPLTMSDIVNLDSTQFIELGNIGALVIEDGFNAHTFTGTEDPVQLQSEGYVIVNTIQNSLANQYLFIGTGGDYGTTGTLTAINEDFTLISNELPVDDVWRNRSGTVKAFGFNEWISHQGNVNLGDD
jgi:hypothetical protein